MALSMDEQRILDQIERGLASADPALATRMASFGAPRRLSALRVRRLRLVASLMTLLVVASVSLVVYALVPFRTVTDRHAGSKASSPAHPVMTAPSHPGHSSPQASAAQASAAPASASPALGASAAASSAASQAPSTHAGTSASPASAHQQARGTPAQ
jgi:cytoskeletal protein RodZ